MCVLHGHCQRGMAKNSLQREDVSTIHHVVTGEGVTQYVGQLTCRQLQPHRFNRLPKLFVAIPKRYRRLDLLLQRLSDRYGPIL